MKPFQKIAALEKVSFLQRSFYVEDEYAKKDIRVISYSTKEEMYFIWFKESEKVMWTVYEEHPSPRLSPISMASVLNTLGIKDRKELIENWNLLKGREPDIKTAESIK